MKRRRTTTGGDLSSLEKRTPPPPPPPEPRRTTYAAVTQSKLRGVQAQPRRRKAPVVQGGQHCCIACGSDICDSDGIRGRQATETRVRCSACDGEYHPGCLDPPRPFVSKRWVCGVCTDTNPRGKGARSGSDGTSSPAAAAAAASTPQLPAVGLQEQLQSKEDEVVVTESHSRFVDVMSSALVRLSGVSDGASGGNGNRYNRGAAGAEQQERPGVMGPVVVAAASASPRIWMGSSLRRGEGRAFKSVADDILAWALRRVGGTGDEGRMMKPVNGERLADCNGIVEGEGGYPDGSRDERSDVQQSHSLFQLSKSGKEGENARMKGSGLRRSEEGEESLVGMECDSESDGDSDDPSDSDSDISVYSGGGNPACWTDEEEGEEDRYLSVDDDSGEEEAGALDFGGIDGDAHDLSGTSLDPACLEEGGGGKSSGALKLGWEEENSRGGGGNDKASDNGNPTAGKALAAAVRSCESGHGFIAASAGGSGQESPGAVLVGAGDGAEQGGALQKKRTGEFWGRHRNTRFLKGVKKHGDAWARLAERFGEGGVAAVEESDGGCDDGSHPCGGSVLCEPRTPVRERETLRGSSSKKRTNKAAVTAAPEEEGGEEEEDSGSRGGDGAKTTRALPRRGSRVPTKTKENNKGETDESKRDKGKKRKRTRKWSEEEHQLFLQAVARHGRSWVAVARTLGTRDNVEVYNHAKRVLNKDLSLKTTEPRGGRNKAGDGTAAAPTALNGYTCSGSDEVYHGLHIVPPPGTDLFHALSAVVAQDGSVDPSRFPGSRICTVAARPGGVQGLTESKERFPLIRESGTMAIRGAGQTQTRETPGAEAGATAAKGSRHGRLRLGVHEACAAGTIPVNFDALSAEATAREGDWWRKPGTVPPYAAERIVDGHLVTSDSHLSRDRRCHADSSGGVAAAAAAPATADSQGRAQGGRGAHAIPRPRPAKGRGKKLKTTARAPEAAPAARRSVAAAPLDAKRTSVSDGDAGGAGTGVAASDDEHEPSSLSSSGEGGGKADDDDDSSGTESDDALEPHTQARARAATAAAGEATRNSNRHCSRRSDDWEKAEHDRFSMGFKKYGASWAKVSRVVQTRDARQVARYAKLRLHENGNLRRKSASSVRAGGWDDDEHERFIKGVEEFGRSWKDVAKVVGTRSRVQVKIHAFRHLEKDLTPKGSSGYHAVASAAPAAPTPAASRRPKATKKR